MPKFVAEISTEALLEIFDLEYEEKLNCSLEEHVARLMAFNLFQRPDVQLSEGLKERLIEFTIGRRQRCEHGRSVMGTCPECDKDDDE